MNSGIGMEKTILLPTKIMREKFTRMTIDGVILDVYYAPGETDDQIFIIYCKQEHYYQLIYNIYQTFPNLYAIGGSPTRDARN